MAAKTSAAETKDRELVITCVFDAPRELVWKAWTEPHHVAQWWGPIGFTTTIHEMDVRRGGIWRHTMHGPDGTDYPNKSTFIEVVKPERIVYSHAGGKKGDSGVRSEVTWIFEAQGNKTKLTLRMVFPSVEMKEHVLKTYGAEEGGKQTLGRLAEHLVTMAETKDNSVTEFAKKEIVLTRIFDAPRNLVFQAWTDPKHMAKWWGPKDFTNPVCELDARVGGAWHIVMRGPDGTEYPCEGVYREIVAPERLVFTNIATNKEGKTILDGLTTVLFAEHNGKTKLTLQTGATAVVQYAVPYLSGMEQGWGESLERLGELLATA